MDERVGAVIMPLEKHMRIRYLTLLICLAGLLLLTSSCARSNNLITKPNISTTLTVPNTHVILTDTPTLLETPYVIPTLPTDKAQTVILNLLANNGNCLLPCLLGITPGESSFEEARKILLPFEGIATSSYLNQSDTGGINIRYVNIEAELNVSIGFVADSRSQYIDRVVLRANAQRKTKNGFEDIFNSNLYSKSMNYYLLSTVLSKYGRPTDVLLFTSADIPPQQPWWPFEIIVSYPIQGILVHYKTPLIIDGTNSVGCPGNSQIQLELRPFGSIDSTEEFLKSYKLPYPDLYKPIEEVTSLSIDEFWEIFSLPTDKCIESPSKYWPPSF